MWTSPSAIRGARIDFRWLFSFKVNGPVRLKLGVLGLTLDECLRVKGGGPVDVKKGVVGPTSDECLRVKGEGPVCVK